MNALVLHILKSSVTTWASRIFNCQQLLDKTEHKLYKKGKEKVAHTRLPSVGFRSWSRFFTVSLQVTRVINPVVGCHDFLPGLQLSTQPLRGLLPILLLGEQRHDECEQFALDCYPTASQLRFEPGPFCTWVQHANHSATEPPMQQYTIIINPMAFYRCGPLDIKLTFKWPSCAVGCWSGYLFGARCRL